MPLAALPMYDRPATAAAHDRLWSGVRDRLRDAGIEAPDSLDRQTPIREGWASLDLLLGQICNLPYRTWYRGMDASLTVLGCGDHRLPETPCGFYHSVVVTRPGADLVEAARRTAYNEGLSHSGWGAAWAWAHQAGVTLTPTLATGAHAASIDAVASGAADLAVIDAVSWAIIRREADHQGALENRDRTAATPAQSFITRHPEPEAVRAALAAAIADLGAEDKDMLCLHGLVTHPEAAYDLPFPPDPSAVAQ